MNLTPFYRLLLVAIYVGANQVTSGEEIPSPMGNIQQLSLKELEQTRADIENELSGLARYSMRSGVGSIGYRSLPHDNPDNKEWIQIQLDREHTIDEIVLVPNISRDAEVSFIADGFPAEFSIIAGKKDDQQGTVVASFSKKDPILPRIAPLIIPVGEIEASWIRIEATVLSPRAYDGRYTLQFSETLIFSGHRNVALQSTVTTSSEQRAGPGAWHQKYLINGYLPYLMDAAEGKPSLAFVSEHETGEHPFITLDLGASYNIDQVILHGVEQGDTVPQAFPGDFGVPRWLQVEGANLADFSDARLLIDYRVRNSIETAPIMDFPIKPEVCRYVRFIARDPYYLEGFEDDGSPIKIARIGFAEIEIYSGETNLALGKIPTASFETESINRTITALTDGNNFYGRILPIRDWMHQLAKRHDLERERPLIDQELERRYDQQEANLRLLIWAIAALFAGTIILYLINRYLRQRAIYALRNRIAADLHDELGANLHAVSMLGELASKAKDDPKKMNGLVERMRALVQRTSRAVKYCTNILETPGLYEDFEDAMKRNASRLLADLDHELIFEAEDTVTKMRAGKRIDLFLFYKECLINIIRHSGATHAETRLKVEGKNLHLFVKDNGCGFPASQRDKKPISLTRRAKLLGGNLAIESPESGGTQIHLSMKV